MSRIGKQPIGIPAGVQVKLDGTSIEVTGPKGKLFRRFNPEMAVKVEKEEGGSFIKVERPGDAPRLRALHGLTRALLANMVTGVSDGFRRELRIEGTGYRAELQGNTLVLMVGYSHPVRFEASGTISFEVDRSGRQVVVHGVDKEEVGELAAKIRGTRPPEPYLGKGIQYAGERIRRKAGKAGAV
ncbi:MAG: 50S ribosomal protein L6 [Anaerolineae bacterium]|nr:50S ribosomal protein L6 [Anaerolineae bacterium]